MKNFKKYLPYILVGIIFVATFIIFYFVLNENKNGKYLKVAYLDVGQGDAIYIKAPNGKQVLIDAGPDAKILSSLSSVMPFADRSIDIVVETHPDLDHIGGMPILFDRYKINTFVNNGMNSNSEVYKILEKKIEKEKSKEIIIKNKKRIILDSDKNIYLDIISPIEDVSDWENTNDGSIVSRLVYGESSFLLMGDATKYTENLISWNESDGELQADILKLGHHGSKGSTSELWLEKVKPSVAIISAGKGNRYDHPDEEVIGLLNKLGIKYLETSKEGNIVFKTDGKNIFQK